MPECYIRGSTIKYLRIPDEVIDMVKEEAQAKSRNRAELSKGRVGNAQNMSQGGSNQRGGGSSGGVRTGNRGNFNKGGGGANASSSGNGSARPNASNNQRLLSQSNQKRK